jgi:hypothetical protein
MAVINDLTALIYNNFRWPVETKVTVNETPVLDRAGRTVTHVAHQIVAKSIIAAGSESVQSDTIQDIKRRLSEQGKSLIFAGAGYGPLTVNVDPAEAAILGITDPDLLAKANINFSIKDVAWGPIPRTRKWVPLGTTAADVEWVCEVSIPVCEDASYTKNLMAHNYTVTFSIDEQGYTTRTISGYAEIPLTRDGTSRFLPDNIDDYWDNIFPLLPRGFRRTVNTRTIDESKKRLTYSVTDIEMPQEILPPDVVECRASHICQSASKMLLRQIATLRASYVLRKGVSKRLAFNLFLDLLEQRINAQGALRSTMVPLSLTVEDSDIFGRAAASISFTWSFILPSGEEAGRRPLVPGIGLALGFASFLSSLGFRPSGGGGGGGDGGGNRNRGDGVQFEEVLNDFVPNSGLWTPTGNSYDTWRRSMTNVMGPRGTIGLGFDVSDDPIVDLCSPGAINVIRQGVQRSEQQAFTIQAPISGTRKVKWLVPQGPASYIIGRSRLRLYYNSHLVHVKRAGGSINVSATSAFFAASLVNNPFATLTSPFSVLGFGSGITTDVKSRTTPTLTAILQYDLVRVGHPPDRPYLVSVGGSRNIIVIKDHPSREVAAHFGNFAHRLRGWTQYLIKDVPVRDISAPNNYAYVYVAHGQQVTGQADVSVRPDASQPL